MQKFKLINSQFIRRFLLLLSENDRTILYYTQQFHTLVNIKREDVSTYTYTSPLGLCPMITSLYPQYCTDSITYIT